MPAAAAVPLIISTTIGFEAIGAAVLTTVGLESIAAGTIAATTGGALVGAGTGALSAAAQGGDIGRGALIGGVSGGVGAAATPMLSSALGLDSNVTGLTGALQRGAVSGVSSGLGGVAGGLVGGKGLGEAARGALPGALAGGLATGLVSGFGYGGGAIPKGDTLGQVAQAGLSSAGTQLLTSALNEPKTPTTAAPSATYRVGTGRAPTQAGAGAGLFSAGGFGYSPGGTVFGSSDKEGKPAKNVWGEGESRSLRDIGSTVT